MSNSNNNQLRLILAAVLVATMTACGGGGGDSPMVPEIAMVPPTDDDVGNGQSDILQCSTEDLNQWVDSNMRDYYLFYDQVPTLTLADYDSPEELIRDLRVQPYDRFSYVNEATTSDERSVEGKSFGLGFRWKSDTNDIARISQVHKDSPLGLAGVQRGDIPVSVGGIPWESLNSDRYDEIVGTRDNPLSAVWVFTDGVDGSENTVTVTASLYDINTVIYANAFDHPSFDGLVGYLVFDQFLETSADELDDVMRKFTDEGIVELILDLRYNGGGRTSIARQLASQISGPATDEQELITYQFNDKYEENNFTRYFAAEPDAQGLNRLIVLTTSRTASSSEIVINSLKPYIDVITIGDTTTGKPYITDGHDYCGKRMHALEAEGVNANGVSVYGGIAADCAASDDVTSDFGVNDDGIAEGMLNSALDYVLYGTCETPSFQAADLTARAKFRDEIAQEGFESGAQGF